MTETVADAPDEIHTRPAGTSDATIVATGKVSEAVEWLERARGSLYDFHQKMGRTDILFGEAVEALRKAGHHQQADSLERDIVGRNVLPGRWTFQLVEAFEETYYDPAKQAEQTIREALVDGRRHIYESEMKERRRTRGQPGHECRPSNIEPKEQ